MSASTSLTPSPVIDTVCPRPCRARTIACFCCGPTRPNTPVASTRSASSSGSSGRWRASNGSSDAGEADPVRHGADGARVVARHHLHGHALGGEVVERGPGVRPDPLLDGDERRRLAHGWGVGGRLPVGAGHQQHPPAPAGTGRRRARRPGAPVGRLVPRAVARRRRASSSTLGAPMIQSPSPPNPAPDQRRADENAARHVGVHPGGSNARGQRPAAGVGLGVGGRQGAERGRAPCRRRRRRAARPRPPRGRAR